jgi:hypothetical protein
MKAERILILSLLAIALVACTQPSASAPTQAPTLPTSAPGVSPAAATNTAQATTAPTSAPTPTRVAPTATPAPAASALPGGDLSEADMTKIFQDSFAAYPWRMKQSVTIKDTQQTITALIEAQSSTRVHMVTQADIGGSMVTIESILITPTLYMKATGAPPEFLREVGAQEGKWLKVPEGSPLAGFAQLAYLVANPMELAAKIGLQNRIDQLNPNQKPHKLVGTESVGNALTNMYESKVGSGDSPITYRVSVGSSDGRIYKMVSDSALRTATTTVEYDPSINIQPPIP